MKNAFRFYSSQFDKKNIEILHVIYYFFSLKYIVTSYLAEAYQFIKMILISLPILMLLQMISVSLQSFGFGFGEVGVGYGLVDWSLISFAEFGFGWEFVWWVWFWVGKGHSRFG